jgi:hypothetical protein
VSTGWPSVRGTLATLGVGFDVWQQGLASAVLGKRKDGLYAADACVMSIPRQVGKTFLVGHIIFALAIIFPKMTAIWTAHRYTTASETFDVMRTMALRPEMGPHIDRITVGSGDQVIYFRNGSRILFGARERGFGRGFAQVDLVVFDEAQILGSNAMDDMVPATNQSRNPLILMMGTPPKPTDPGDIFSTMRSEAISGESDGVLYVEFSADQDADPLDRKQWAKANPSFPTRTSARAIMRMRKLLGVESFPREALGIWDPLGEGIIPKAAWTSSADTDSRAGDVRHFGLDVSPERSWAAVGVASKRADGRTHTELTSRDGVVDHRQGVDWVVPRLVQLAERWEDDGFVIHVLDGSAAMSLVPRIEDAGVLVNIIGASEVAPACGLFYDEVVADRVRHVGQLDLTVAFEGAARLNVGDNAWKLGRRKSSTDITPAYAVIAATWALHEYVPESNVW